MKDACRALIDSCKDSSKAYEELDTSLRSLRGVVGSSSQRRSYKNLKRLGVAIMLAPSPEPFTDLVGLALIGASEVGERVRPPLTLSDMPEESYSLFKSLENARPFNGKGSMWDPM